MDSYDMIAAQAMGIVGVVLVVGEYCVPAWHQIIEPTAHGPDPQIPLVILGDRSNAQMSQAAGEFFVAWVADKDRRATGVSPGTTLCRPAPVPNQSDPLESSKIA